MKNFNERPTHIEQALIRTHPNQWFGWPDPSNKIYANLKLSEKIGVDGNIIDNPITELPSEEELNAKLAELQADWDSKNV